MSKQEETLIKALLDAKKPEEALLRQAEELVTLVRGGDKIDMEKAGEILSAAREIRIALNLVWSAYTKRDIPYDLGGSAPATRPVEALPEPFVPDNQAHEPIRRVRRIPARRL